MEEIMQVEIYNGIDAEKPVDIIVVLGGENGNKGLQRNV